MRGAQNQPHQVAHLSLDYVAFGSLMDDDQIIRRVDHHILSVVTICPKTAWR
jgi:hypothetical protein